jgi:hypothetical protein
MEGERIFSAPFCGASDYWAFYPPSHSVNFTFLNSANATIATRIFTVQPGAAYTLGVTGALPGPSGQLLYNTSPLVIMEDIRIPNPGNFRGSWYRWSETDLVIDFRAYQGGLNSVNQTADYMRMRANNPKTVIPYTEMIFGTYSFHPVTLNSTEILVNNNYDPPQSVGIFGQVYNQQAIYDFLACGNSLLSTKPNTLRIFQFMNVPKLQDDCLLVNDLTLEGAPDYSGANMLLSSSLAVLLGLIHLLY